MDENNLLKKLSSMICDMSMSPSIIVLPMDLPTEKAHQNTFWQVLGHGVRETVHLISIRSI
jgi:hypothetical protein